MSDSRTSALAIKSIFPNIRKIPSKTHLYSLNRYLRCVHITGMIFSAGAKMENACGTLSKGDYITEKRAEAGINYCNINLSLKVRIYAYEGKVLLCWCVSNRLLKLAS